MGRWARCEEALAQHGRPRHIIADQEGVLTSMLHRCGQWTKPEKPANVLPLTIERRVFADTQVTAYRIAA